MTSRAAVSRRGLASLSLAVLVVLTLLVPIASTAALAQETETETETPVPTVTPVDGGSENTEGSNTTAGAGGPTLADRSRVTAVQFDREYLRTVRRPEGDGWNTTGPYAVFTSSSTVEAARISQPNADAVVLDGGRTVQVSYTAEAAGQDSSTYYTLELFYEDGSSRTLDLYARQTDQIVSSAEVEDAEDFLDTMREDAEEHGYAPTIEGVEKYHEWEKQQADLFTNLFGPQFEKLFAWTIITVQTPFALIGLGILVLVAAWRILRVHGWKLRSMQNSADLTEQRRRELDYAYREAQSTADEERLEDVEEIGPYAVYWLDALGVSSTKQLADLFAFGRPATDESGQIIRDTEADPIEDPETGDIQRWPNGDPVYPPVWDHRGVASLRNAPSLRESWLEPMLRPDMLGSESSALAHGRRALKRMTSHYSQPQYRAARAELSSMLEQMNDGNSQWTTFGGTGGKHSSSQPSTASDNGHSGSWAGGDD